MSKEIKNMDFKELRNEVQRLRDELAIMQRKYEDILYNLDDENFSGEFIKEKNGMKTQIELNEEGIKTKVSNEDFNSVMQQTAEKISMEVSKAITTKFVSDVMPTRNNTSDEQKKSLCEYNGVLYYWNDIASQWKKAPYADGVKSQFLQTADGFELTGDVAVSGDLVAGGSIKGSTLVGGALYDASETYRLELKPSNFSGTPNFALFNDSYSNNIPYFSVWDNAMGNVGLYALNRVFIGTYDNDNNFDFTANKLPVVMPYGTWDFSHSGVEVIGIGGGEATFG